MVVSTGDLQDRIDKWIKPESKQALEQESSAENTARYSRPDLSSDYVGPGNQTEQTIADIWQELQNGGIDITLH